MENQFKKFHFQELGWLVYFPIHGNEGKYNSYFVFFKRGLTQPEKRVKLEEILDDPEFEQRYPHTIGYYRESTGDGENLKPEYLELRKVCTVEEFWFLLNSLNI